MMLITVLPEVLLLTGLGICSALLLLAARQRLAPETDSVVTEVNRLLPQTQCAQCGYPGCRPYAEAIIAGEAINKCPPGGDETIVNLAALLGREQVSLDASLKTVAPAVAVIREAECIGCTLCIPACPVDAIVGAPQMMHTVIEQRCTGCDLCLEPCPVDCIDLVPLPQTAPLPRFPIEHTACINCGDCVEACPRDLQPHMLYRAKTEVDRLEHLQLDRCIACFRCDQVCPSELSLTQTFRVAKAHISHEASLAEKSRQNELYFEAREQRMSASTRKIRKRPSRGDKASLLAALKDDA